MRSVVHDAIPIAPLRIKEILRSTPVYALLAILVIGGFVRFARIAERGVFIHDEAHFLNVVRTYGDAIRWAWENRSAVRGGTLGRLGDRSLSPARTGGDARELALSEAKGYLLRRGGSFLATGKEGHIAAQATFSLLYGLRPTTGVALSGIFGLATIVLVFAWGARFYDLRTALIGAAGLAASALFLKYSRSGLAQADSIFFAYLGALFYLISRERKHARGPSLALAGLCVAIAFTCHYNVAYVLIVLISAEIIFPVRGSMRAPLARLGGVFAALVIVGAFCLLLVLFDIPFEALRLAIRRAYPGFYSYFGDLRYHWLKYHAGSAAFGAPAGRLVFDDPFYFVRLLIAQEGLAAAMLVVGALVFFIWRFIRHPRCEEFVLLALFAVPAVVWSFYSFRVERSYVVAVPAAALMFGRALAVLIETLRISDAARQLTLIGALLIILLAGYFNAEQGVLGERTNFREGARTALDYALRTDGHITERSFSWHAAPMWKFYLAYEADHRADAAAAWRCLNLGSADQPDLLLLDATTRSDPEFSSGLAQGKVVALVPATPTLGTIFICDVRTQPTREYGQVQRASDKGDLKK